MLGVMNEILEVASQIAREHQCEVVLGYSSNNLIRIRNGAHEIQVTFGGDGEDGRYLAAVQDSAEETEFFDWTSPGEQEEFRAIITDFCE